MSLYSQYPILSAALTVLHSRLSYCEISQEGCGHRGALQGTSRCDEFAASPPALQLYNQFVPVPGAMSNVTVPANVEQLIGKALEDDYAVTLFAARSFCILLEIYLSLPHRVNDYTAPEESAPKETAPEETASKETAHTYIL